MTFHWLNVARFSLVNPRVLHRETLQMTGINTDFVSNYYNNKKAIMTMTLSQRLYPWQQHT